MDKKEVSVIVKLSAEHCGSRTCSECRYGLKPSECTYWDFAVRDFVKNKQDYLFQLIDEYYNV